MGTETQEYNRDVIRGWIADAPASLLSKPWYDNDFGGLDLTPGGELRLRICLDDQDVLIHRFERNGWHVWSVRFGGVVPDAIIQAALYAGIAEVGKDA